MDGQERAQDMPICWTQDPVPDFIAWKLTVESQTMPCRLINHITARYSLFVAIVMCLSAQAFGQQDKPFDLFERPIDNMQIYRHFERTATLMMSEQREGAVEAFQRQLKEAPADTSVDLSSLVAAHPEGRRQLYEHMVKSTLYIGELYNCGRCDRTHAGFAGGVLISEDGLALTNYHVLESRDTGKTEGIYAMTWDGRCWAFQDILFASESDDLALIRLKAEGQKFHAAAIAAESPQPMDPIRIISHPSGEFFVMTSGEVSRYARMRRSRAKQGRGDWMEVTASFGSGSSGCGVFNDRGQVVGVVSSIRPLMRSRTDSNAGDDESRRSENSTRYVEMMLRKCVPLSAILSGFKSSP